MYELLLPHRATHVVIGLAAVCLGSTARYLGRLALTMGDRDAARTHLACALDANQALRAPVVLAHSQIDVALVTPSPAEARSLLAAAAATAARLQLPALAQRVARARGD